MRSDLPRDLLSKRLCWPVILVAATALSFSAEGQEQPFNRNGSVKFNLPADSPISVTSCNFDESSATDRGGALTLDVHMDISLRNSAPRRVRGITMLIVAHETAPVGKASVARLVDVGPGETFPMRVDVRLLRPNTASGPLVQVNLDGVLFDDLNFYGPNRLNSKRTMTFWEMEARRDRQYFKQVLAARGINGLQDEVVSSLHRQDEVQHLDVRLSRGRTTTGLSNVPGRMEHFVFLQIPDAPVRATEGWAEISGAEVRSPTIEVQNLSGRAVKYVEIAWLVQDNQGRQYLAGSVPASAQDLYLPAGRKGELVQDTSLRFSRANSLAALNIDKMVGVVSQVEFSDGKVWVPRREELAASNALGALAPSPEEQRLTDIYRKRGIRALVQELSKFQNN